MNWDGGLAGDALASYKCSYDVSTPFDISTISNTFPHRALALILVFQILREILKLAAMVQIFFIDRDAKSVKQWALTTAYGLSTASSDTEYVFGNWAALKFNI